MQLSVEKPQNYSPKYCYAKGLTNKAEMLLKMLKNYDLNKLLLKNVFYLTLQLEEKKETKK